MAKSRVPAAYSLKRVMVLWLAATGPSAALVWGMVPLIVAHTSMLPVVAHVLGLLACGAWTSLVGLWALAHDGITLRHDGLRAALFLGRPGPSPERLARLRRTVLFVAVGAMAYLPFVVWYAVTTLPPFLPGPGILQFLILSCTRLQPGYTRPFALADPALAHAFWFVPLAVVAWAANALMAEELFFRGLLLPRMQDRSGRGRIGASALLYFAYCLALRPFSAPPRLVYGLLAALLARRAQSTRPALRLRALEGLLVGALAAVGVSTTPLPPITAAPSLPHISRRPGPAVWGEWKRRAPWPTLPEYRPDSHDTWQLDLRGKELAGFDLSGRSSDLLMATFDDTTVWPETLPAGFSPDQVLELGRNPGLGVRRLHERGITGRGVGIGIVDMPLLVDHAEYAGRLRWYEEINTIASARAQMHGPAVASIAVGRSAGVAPGASLYYVACGDDPRNFLALHQPIARGIQRLVEVNRWLPPSEKMRVISISRGWMSGQTGYEEVTRAIRHARAEGIFVIHCAMERETPFAFHGLGREALADPARLDSFGPGLWWKAQFLRGGNRRSRLLVPMESRTTASPTGADHYVFYRSGGWSWVAPYIAGLYALALQVDPQLTGEAFWELALETGRTRTIANGERRLPLGPIADPEALVAAVARRVTGPAARSRTIR